MLTQSERMTTAREAAFRINQPNSQQRKSIILGLDEDSRDIVGDLIGLEWNGARFYSVSEKTQDTSVDIEDRDGNAIALSEALDHADVVMMVATHDTDPERVKAVGEACFASGTMTSGFVLDDSGDLNRVQATLSAVRPYVISLVVGSDEDFLIEVLRAIRA